MEKSSHIWIPQHVHDPNEDAGVPQDLEFGGQNTVLKRDKITDRDYNHVRYWRIKDGDRYIYHYSLEGQPMPKEAEFVSRRDGIIHCMFEGDEKKYEHYLMKWRLAKSGISFEEKKLIRNTPTIEKEILTR